MTTEIEYALMAGASYRSNRDPLNRFPIPSGWSEVAGFYRNLPSGFEAAAFTKGTEVVISFAGTDFSQVVQNYSFLGWDFWNGNIPLITGISVNGADQLVDAVEYYLQVKASVPAGTHITLTGHSLGGALAALVGVFFGETAVTIDQVPATQTAMAGSATLLRDALLSRGHTAIELAGLNNYLQLQQTYGGIPNAVFVTDYNVQGEVAGKYIPGPRIGSDFTINCEQSGIGAADLHSIALLTAFRQSGDLAGSTSADHTLGQVTYKLTDLLKMIFDPKLFYNDPLKKIDAKENFLERLVKHEAGNGTILPSDTMVTRFTSDLWKLAQDGGLTINDGNTSNPDVHDLSKALIAFAMQKYYEEKSTTPKTELFTDIFDEGAGSGGIHFDLADVSDKLAKAASLNEEFNLTEKDDNGNYYLKGYQNLLWYLNQSNNGFTDEERSLIHSLLPYLRDWYIQAGAGGMTANDTLGFGSGAFIPHSPSLAEDKNLFEVLGGTADDMLVGNAANDSSYIERTAA